MLRVQHKKRREGENEGGKKKCNETEKKEKFSFCRRLTNVLLQTLHGVAADSTTHVRERAQEGGEWQVHRWAGADAGHDAGGVTRAQAAVVVEDVAHSVGGVVVDTHVCTPDNTAYL